MRDEQPSRSWWSRLASRLGGGEPERPAPAAPLPPRPAPPSGPVDAGLSSFILKMPKVELHVHLEGALRPASLLSLARKNGVRLPADDEAGVRKWFRFRDFAHFLEIYRAMSRCLREPDDFRVLAHDFVAEQAIQNVVYSEVHFTVATHAGHGVDPRALRQALWQALDEGEKRHGVRVRLIPDVVRDDGEAAADLTLAWALEESNGGGGRVAALGLTGTETLPSAPFRRHFDAARAAGLRLTAHAGEHGGPDSMRAVLDAVAPERIDHGVRAVEDAAFLAELAARRLPLTACLTSNVALGVVPDYASHPFDRLVKGGANVSVSSDDPQVMQTNLCREYLHLHRLFGYGAAELAELSLAGLRQAFLPEDERARMEEEFRRRYRELGERYLGAAVEP